MRMQLPAPQGTTHYCGSCCPTCTPWLVAFPYRYLYAHFHIITALSFKAIVVYESTYVFIKPPKILNFLSTSSSPNAQTSSVVHGGDTCKQHSNRTLAHNPLLQLQLNVKQQLTTSDMDGTALRDSFTCSLRFTASSFLLLSFFNITTRGTIQIRFMFFKTSRSSSQPTSFISDISF